MQQICLVGGDARMDYAACALEAAGYTVARIAPDEIAQAKACGSLIVGGGLPTGSGCCDYLQNEAFLYDNARLTAEGALMLLGSHTKGSLFGADVGVIGMGRIAECLCLLLRAVGARVTVYARRAEALSRARALGAEIVRFREHLPDGVMQHEMISNTVPHVLFGAELLALARHNTLLLELASAPGGFDRAAVAEMGLLYINGQGLPGKYAPRAAGELIAAYVLDVLKGEIPI